MPSCLEGCLPGAPVKRPPPRPQKQRVEVDVGGQRFCTSRATLTSRPDSVLAKLLAEEPEEDGVYFLDRDGKLFGLVLSFLRDGPQHFRVPASEQVRSDLRHEAEQLGLPDLVALLTDGPLAGSEPADDGAHASNGKSAANGVAKAEKNAQAEGTVDYLGAPLPCNELQRLAKLKSLDVLYTGHEHQYDCVTSVVAAILDVPIVLLSLVNKDEQWFKSKCGLDADTTPRNTSFCAFMLKPEIPQAAAMLLVEDARRDPRVADNPLVTGEPYIRFYAGCPLVTSDGLRLGALCAIDRIPHSLSPSQAQLLVNFGQISVQELERRKLQEEEEDLPILDEEGPLDLDFAAGSLREQRMRDAISEIVVLVWVHPGSKDWTVLYANEPWTDMTGIRVKPPHRFPGRPELADMRAGGKAPERPAASLWDHLQLSATEENKLKTFRDVLAGLLSQSGRQEQPTFALSAILQGSGDSRVFCRFSPADAPLDVAAAAIRPACQAANGSDGFTLRGYPPGFLYFVVMTQQGGPPKGGTPAPAPPPAAAPAPAPVAAPPPPPPEKVAPTGPVADVVDPALFPQEGKRLDLTFLRMQSQEAVTTAPPSAPRPGAAVAPAERKPASPYEDVRLLRMAGEGSFGKVYFGLWNGTSVAVKVICNLSSTHQKLTLSPDVEAELSSLISHPNLVKTYQYCMRRVRDETIQAEKEASEAAEAAAGLPPAPTDRLEMWIVQEWCDGGTLREYCKQPKMEGAGIIEALEVGLEIASGIAYLHDRNIIHGDLTPNNVMLQIQPTRKGYICKVCDFGRARICDADTQEIMTRTMGTVTHMPPELFVTNIESCCLTPKADIYALGVILYEVVTAKCPFAGLSPPQVVLRVASGKRLELPNEVPMELMSVYKACVSREPQDRPTAGQLIDSLTHFHTQFSHGQLSAE